MSLSLLAACLWALAATVTAFLPMRRQFSPGIALLVLAPLIVIWIGIDHGLWPALFGLAGFLSMFRRPLLFFARKALRRLPSGWG